MEHEVQRKHQVETKQSIISLELFLYDSEGLSVHDIDQIIYPNQLRTITLYNEHSHNTTCPAG